MNSHTPQKTVIVLSEEETRLWHSIFSRELRDHNRARILEQCEASAKAAGAIQYVVYDAYESFVAKGQITPAA